MKSVFLRNVAATAAIVALSIIILIMLTLGMGRSQIIKEYKETMLASAHGVADMAAAIVEYEGIDSWSLSISLNLISSTTDDQLFICDNHGMIRSCADKPSVCKHIHCVIPNTYLQSIDENGILLDNSSLEGILDAKQYVIGLPIVLNNGNTEGYIFVSKNVSDITAKWNRFTNLMLLMTFGIFLITIVLSVIYSKRMAKPLDEMAVASGKFARGDFSVRVKQVSETADEMGTLIESFNKMADSLEAAEKRRSEFIANISHELRTPMTTIAGFADGILDGTIPRDQQDKYLVSIRDETRRLSRLVREMLDVSQTNARAAKQENRTEFDITELVLQTMLSFESRATQKNLDVDPQLPDNSIMVRADKDAITRVIYNLIDNAVKFAYPDTCIGIKVYKQDGKAYVSIKDKGETIPPDDLPFIFDRFHKSDRSRSLDKVGVGLGLYLVKAIINSHDENIAVKSENNITEFVFTLPLAD